MKLDATFEITAWEPDDYDAPADGPPLTRATVRKAFSGALRGESVAELLACGELGYAANERVSGALDGRSGTFVLQHGAWEGGQWGFVVPGSGTGELAGLRGDARIEHGRLALRLLLLGQQRARELVGVERAQVLELLADPDQLDRDARARWRSRARCRPWPCRRASSARCR